MYLGKTMHRFFWVGSSQSTNLSSTISCSQGQRLPCGFAASQGKFDRVAAQDGTQPVSRGWFQIR